MSAGTALSTLLLDVGAWDLCLDAGGDIAVASPPYALAQDVATEQRTILGECWYDKTRGIPYFSKVLGQAPNPALLKAWLQNAAMRVPGVVGATTYITGLSESRTLNGQTQIKSTSGETTSVGF